MQIKLIERTEMKLSTYMYFASDLKNKHIIYIFVDKSLIKVAITFYKIRQFIGQNAFIYANFSA